MRFTAAIGVILLALGGCPPGSSQPASAQTPVRQSSLSCEPWPVGNSPSRDHELVVSPEQELPGIDESQPSVSVVAGYACVVLPANRRAERAYCGAAESGGEVQSCLVGEECAVGSIMVTELVAVAAPGGTQLCATFENWSKIRARAIFLWAKTR